MEDVNKIVAKYIREYRTEKDYTQEQLAEKSNLHPSYIGKIEIAAQACSLKTLAKIAQALEIPIQALLGPIPVTYLDKLQNKQIKKIIESGTVAEKQFLYDIADYLLKKRNKKK